MYNLKRIMLSLVIVLILGTYWYYLRKAEVPTSSKQQKISTVSDSKVKRDVLSNPVHTLGTIHVQRQLNVIVVKYLLPGKYASAVKPGQKVIVRRITGSKKETTEGIVTIVDRSGTKYVRDIHVTANLPKPTFFLKPGLIVSVTQFIN